MGKNSKEFTIVIDSREQRPYSYKGAVVKALKSGDYSILGIEDKVAIERKSKEDAYSSLGQGRGRFEREIKRLSEYDYAAIVIESSLENFLKAPAFSRMNPRSAVGSILAWSVKYKVCVFFACDRRHARALTRQLLEKYYRYHHGETDGEGEDNASV